MWIKMKISVKFNAMLKFLHNDLEYFEECAKKFTDSKNVEDFKIIEGQLNLQILKIYFAKSCKISSKTSFTFKFIHDLHNITTVTGVRYILSYQINDN